MEPSGDDVEGKLGGVVGVDMGVVKVKEQQLVHTIKLYLAHHADSAITHRLQGNSDI